MRNYRLLFWSYIYSTMLVNTFIILDNFYKRPQFGQLYRFSLLLFFFFAEIPKPNNVFYISGLRPFWHQGLVSWKTIFPWTGGQRGDGLEIIQAHYTYYVLYFYCYYISSTSDHQALDPGDWGPLFCIIMDYLISITIGVVR